MLLVAVTALSCEKSGLEIKSGNVLGNIEVSASAGQISVSVETVGRWIVYVWATEPLLFHIRIICLA